MSPNRLSRLAVAFFTRPLMLAFWVFVLWGTLYAASLAYATVIEGTSALRRPLSGHDPIAGIVNLIAGGLATLVWGTIGLVLLFNRAETRSRPGT